jgi:hypothetical protein
VTTAREFIEDLQRGQEVHFPGGPAVRLPQLTGPAIAQALLAVVPPLAPLNLPLMVSEREFWFIFSPYAHHVTADVHEQPGPHTVTVNHTAYPIRSLTTVAVQTRFQAASRSTDLLSATLIFGFPTSKPFELTADYQGDDRTRLSPGNLLAFAQNLLLLSRRSGPFGLQGRKS